jgi:hypothetical protein
MSKPYAYVYLDDYPRTTEEYKPSIEVVIAEDAVREAEDTLELLCLAELWELSPEDTAQIIADGMRLGATYGETIRELLEEAKDNDTG